MNYTLTIGQNFNRIEFAKWVLTLQYYQNNKSVPWSLKMADDLIGGWGLQFYLTQEEKAAGESFCNVTEVVYIDPYAAERKIQAEYFALRDRGAAGDIEAAIAYCKLEVQGLPNHSACVD
jgi:hypothetical protein